MAYSNDDTSAINKAFIHSSITTSAPLQLNQPIPTKLLQDAYTIRESDLRTKLHGIKNQQISREAYQSKEADLQNALQRIKSLESNVMIYCEDSMKVREAYNHLKIKYQNLKASVGTKGNGVERVELGLGCKEENGRLRKEVETLQARFEKFEGKHMDCREQGTEWVKNIWRTANKSVERDAGCEGQLIDNDVQLRLEKIEKQLEALQIVMLPEARAHESSYSREKTFQYRKPCMEDVVINVMGGQNKENLARGCTTTSQDEHKIGYF